ncbi:proline-rich protein 19 [Vanacampus margaritifer]
MATSPVFKMSLAPEGRSIGACKCQTDTSKPKMKRLRSRKERSQTRGSKDASKVKARHCHRRCGLDVEHLRDCGRHARRSDGASLSPPLCDALAPTQEASVITEARLLGHRGFFNREVKSIDIKRLLLGKKETKAKTTSPKSASFPDEEAEATVAREKKSQASDVTPDQMQQAHPSSLTSAHTPVAKRTKPDPRGRPPSSAERTPPRKKLPEPPRAPSPIPRRPVAVKTSVDAHAQSEEDASKSIGVVAQRLRDTLRFPLMRKRDLLAESREVLLRALRQAHGQNLQQNLLHMQSGNGLQPHPRKEVQNPKTTRKDRDRRLTPGPFQVHFSDSFYFGSEDAPVLENVRKERKRVSWDLSAPQQQHFSRTDAWPTSPMDTSADFLEDIFRPRVSPEFSMDFGSSSCSSAAVHQLFAPFPAWRAEPPARDFDRTAVELDPFEDCFARRRSSRSQASYTQLSPCRELAGRYSPPNFSAARDTVFERQQYSFASTFSSQPFTSLHDHRCQPSYNLESPAFSFMSLSSPKHWSFRPRKLY